MKDLVDQFREFGPRFNVVVLDTETFGYERRLDGTDEGRPGIEGRDRAAPENSIFFSANKRVQRLGVQRVPATGQDRAAREANGGRGNLVLLPQGVENFARRVLAVQERRPKVAVCVVHEWLSTADTDGAGASPRSPG